jgi:hypothetical protein
MNLHVIERHHQLLEIWRQEGRRSLSVVHVDFHCDLRGLLIDRSQQLAYRIRDVREGLDEGNFLRHAIEQGIVTSVRWVHGTPGGRRFDVNTVKYWTDVTAMPHRWALAVTRRAPFGLRYEVQTMDQWNGLAGGEFLDIDWDTFAEKNLPPDEIGRRVEEFLAKDLSRPPCGVAACYSPFHSQPSRDAFRSFVDRLARDLSAQVIDVPYTPRPERNLPWRRRVIVPLLRRRFGNEASGD